jgi:hypothetical protein
MKGQIQSTHVSEQHERVDLEVPDVIWYKDAGLQKLYAMMPIFFLGSTLTGYDGSLLNGLQTMAPWQECKDPQKKIVSLSSNLLTIRRLWPSHWTPTWFVLSDPKYRWFLRCVLWYVA